MVVVAEPPATAHARMDVTPVKESRAHPPSESTDSGYDFVDASYGRERAPWRDCISSSTCCLAFDESGLLELAARSPLRTSGNVFKIGNVIYGNELC